MTGDSRGDPGAIDIDIDIVIVIEVETSASPEQVWQVLWDLDRYAEWNPECVEAHWFPDSSEPAVGARFTGRNLLNGNDWTVTCHVIECTPPTFVRWTVQDPACPSSTWSYTITGTGTGSMISERFVHGPGNSGIRNMIRSNPDRAATVIAARTRMLTTNIQTGLGALVTLAEGRTRTPGASSAG